METDLSGSSFQETNQQQPRSAGELRVSAHIPHKRAPIAERVLEDDEIGFPLSADLEKLTAPFEQAGHGVVDLVCIFRIKL